MSLKIGLAVVKKGSQSSSGHSCKKAPLRNDGASVRGIRAAPTRFFATQTKGRWKPFIGLEKQTVWLQRQQWGHVCFHSRIAENASHPLLGRSELAKTKTAAPASVPFEITFRSQETLREMYLSKSDYYSGLKPAKNASIINFEMSPWLFMYFLKRCIFQDWEDFFFIFHCVKVWLWLGMHGLFFQMVKPIAYIYVMHTGRKKQWEMHQYLTIFGQNIVALRASKWDRLDVWHMIKGVYLRRSSALQEKANVLPPQPTPVRRLLEAAPLFCAEC